MGKPNFSEDFKRDAVHQITERGYPVREVSERLGVSTYSLYKWMKLYAKAASHASHASSVDHEAENRRPSEDIGDPMLATHMHSILMFQRLAIANGYGWKRFLNMVDQVLPRRGQTIELLLGYAD